MSAANGLTTGSITFGNIPAIDDCLFEVRAGIDTRWAASTAACLADSIAHIATDAVARMDGVSPEVAYLVAFAADAVHALSDSVHSAHSRKGTGK